MIVSRSGAANEALRNKAAKPDGATIMVNLTAEAERYLFGRDTCGDRIIKWSLTNDFEFRGCVYNNTVHPVTASVQEMNCSGEKTGSPFYGRQDPSCKNKFTWTIQNGIISPFRLVYNITAPMIEQPGKRQNPKGTARRNFNNKTQVNWETTGAKKIKNRQTWYKFTQSCTFFATVSVKGWIAVQYAGNGNYQYGAIGVGSIENNATGLVQKADDELAYNITGKYSQEVCIRGG